MERTPPPGRGHMAGCPAGLESRAGQLTTVFASSCASSGFSDPIPSRHNVLSLTKIWLALRADPFDLLGHSDRAGRVMTRTHSSWVAREAAKHVTSASIRQRINHEQKQILILDGIGVGARVTHARTPMPN